jgi:hypothetical protein
MCENHNDLLAEIERLRSRVSGLVAALDQHHGTPCEQIRHEQEVERLRAALREITQLRADEITTAPSIARAALKKD